MSTKSEKKNHNNNYNNNHNNNHNHNHNHNNRRVGIFFTVENNKFVTMVDYRSKNRFIKLIENFSKNAEIYNPKYNDQFVYIDVNIILQLAYKKLENKPSASKLIYTLMAQNNTLQNNTLQNLTM